ncbi:YhjD/YihY/BrkB family envelope integrity protein [Prauserella marina]|uniref:YhjD/YihY/BrkB family envelope integrity protein n=1 Tax=Prauserella marina TaxID=530584 RepID=UPI001FE30846|nr:YhjD/YihY/BrkB family envelope integrity protein [Prauserella marina]
MRVIIRTQRLRLRAALLNAAERHPPVAVAIEVAQRDRRSSGRLLAAALAFRLFLWLLPCALLVVALLGFGAGHNRELVRRTGLGPVTGSVFEQIGIQAQQSRYVLAVLGAASLCLAGVALSRTFDGMNERIRPGAESDSGRLLLRRSARYTAVMLGFTVACVAGPLLHSAAGLPVPVASLCVLAVLVPLAVLLMRTGTAASFAEVLPGALVFVAGLEVLRLVAAYVLPAKLSRASELYGTLGVAAALLVWLTLLARFVVLGHVLNAVLAERRPSLSRPRPVRGRARARRRREPGG